MTSIDFASPSTLSQPAGYSQVVSFTPGRIVWTAGQVPIAADGTVAPAGDWEERAGLVLADLLLEIEAVACVAG